MSPGKYFRLQVQNLLRAHEDLFSEAAFRAGAQGVSENLKFQQRELIYEPNLVETPTLDLDVFFEKIPERAFFEELQTRFPECTVSTSEEENKDWLSEWRKHFREFCLVGDTWVVPSWLKAPAEAKRVIHLDPGMAFGTGTHETTRLAAEFIWDLRRGIADRSLLDIGTGSGILAILAERIGCQECIGLDIDPEARRVARENGILNECENLQIPETMLEDWDLPADIVIANIIDGVLVNLRSHLFRLVQSDGHLILSGILQERDSDFLQRMELPRDFEVISRRSQGEWVAYLLKRK